MLQKTLFSLDNSLKERFSPFLELCSIFRVLLFARSELLKARNLMGWSHNLPKNGLGGESLAKGL